MKKNNLILIILIIILVVASILLINLNNQNKEPDKSLTTQELMDMDYVDKKLEKLTKSISYQELSLENKIIEVEKELKKLKESKYIDYYNYDDKNYLFSFQYKCGVLGGVMVKEFDSMLN